MNKTQRKTISSHNLKRLERIGMMLREMRFSEGRNQNEFIEDGISRRQIQRGECGSNLSLISLFKLLDLYNYRLDEFFEDMD